MNDDIGSKECLASPFFTLEGQDTLRILGTRNPASKARVLEKPLTAALEDIAFVPFPHFIPWLTTRFQYGAVQVQGVDNDEFPTVNISLKLLLLSIVNQAGMHVTRQ
jgi:hypothetical protein